MCQARRWIRLRRSASTGRSVRTPRQGTFRSEGDCRRKRSAQDGHARLLSSIPVRVPCQQTTRVLSASKQYRAGQRIDRRGGRLAIGRELPSRRRRWRRSPSPQPRHGVVRRPSMYPLYVVCHADGHTLHPRLGAISWSPSTVTRSRARGFGLGRRAGCFESAESKRLDRDFWSDRALRLAVSPELEILEQLARIQPARRPDHLRCTKTGTRAAPE
jgi:hypothetical protein